ncbi:ABC transporter ATP-binding protein [Trueperella pecoris]|uniref:ABC transporter ATP-binding protein n=1 Tax=Trueperella pecoris TaxID=2733571 RepID=A0A7M1R239_9ACTO|nr:ABC transporter ATP-binding protein [Trueperella pecoris]QOR48392.1 ABC transporter ATP-binding protein [Trueperella pecoris]
MTTSQLVIDHLSVPKILDDICLSVDEGKILAVVGPSGCGKSTLIHAVAGAVASTGRILVGDRDITDLPMHLRPTGTVFQESMLFPDHDVWSNVAFGLDDARMKDSRRSDLVDLTLAQLNISSLARLPVGHLSGGQAQRVALARTLVRRPRILLLDEPLVHVDPPLRGAIQTDIVAQVKRNKLATIYVTHDVDEACRLGDLIALMDGGRIVQIGSPTEVYRRPVSAFVARIMGIANILDGKITHVGPDHAKVEFGRTWLALPHVQELVPSRAHVVVPPETIVIGEPDQGMLAGRIIRSIFARTHMEYELETAVGTLVVTEADTTSPRPLGAEVSLLFTYCWFIGDFSLARMRS